MCPQKPYLDHSKSNWYFLVYSKCCFLLLLAKINLLQCYPFFFGHFFYIERTSALFFKKIKKWILSCQLLSGMFFVQVFVFTIAVMIEKWRQRKNPQPTLDGLDETLQVSKFQLLGSKIWHVVIIIISFYFLELLF